MYQAHLSTYQRLIVHNLLKFEKKFIYTMYIINLSSEINR